MTEIITEYLSFASPLISLVVIPIMARLITRSEKRTAEIVKAEEQRAKEREHDSERFMGYVMWGILAVGRLSDAGAISIRQGKCNGELKKAQDDFHEFEKAIERFKTQQAAKTL
ncbi:MAG: hypothetical protein FWH17_06105 [Oscillospiraceae bacterium]|nr:hypothetical protein [Oscillospiraceae bacterium]